MPKRYSWFYEMVIKARCISISRATNPFCTWRIIPFCNCSTALVIQVPQPKTYPTDKLLNGMILQLKLLVIIFLGQNSSLLQTPCVDDIEQLVLGATDVFLQTFTIVPSNSHPHLLPHSHHPSEATMPSDYRCMGLLHNPHSLKSSHNQQCHNCPASSHGCNRGFSKCYIPYPMLCHKTSTCTFPIFPHEKVMYLYTGLSP